MIAPGRVLALAEKEVRHVLRDPRTLYLALGMPVVMLLLFGFGISFDLENVPVAFVDADRSSQSRALRRRLTASSDLRDAGSLTSSADATRALVAGRATAVVVFERGWGDAVVRGEEAPVQVLLDGADSNTAVQTRAKLEAAIARLGARAAVTSPGGGMAPPIEARTFTRFNPEGRSAVFLVPGITAYVLAIVAVLLTALTVAREWERGSMAQLFATPVTRLEIVLGKLLPYLALGTLTVLLVLAVGMWVFDVPFRGDVLTLVLLSFLFIAGMLGQGLLISIATRNQMAATQIATMSSMLPSMLLSGFMFPIENMPPALQTVTLAIPARYYVEGLRGVLLRGNSLAEQWPQVLALLAFACVMVALSTARFRKDDRVRGALATYVAMFVAVVEKEVRQTARDRMMIGLLIVVPVVQLFVFGHAVNLDVDRVPTVVVDGDGTATSRAHLAGLFADGTLTRVASARDAETADGYLTRGEAAVVLVLPRGFERDIVRGRPATVQAVLDGSDPNRSGVASAAVAGYFAAESGRLVRVRLQQRAALGQPAPPLASTPARSRVLFNPQLETALYMVPGVAAILLLLITTIVTAMGLARERERGTLEQILVTPVPGAVLIGGKILPFAVFGIVDFGLAMVVGAYGFDMPIRGHLGVLLLATALYLMTTLSVGLLISTLSGSQQQAFMGGFLFMLPAALLSGIMTPVGSMPEWLQPLTLVNPVRHYAEVLRGVLLRGAGVADLSLQLAVLATMGACVFVVATVRFRSTLR